MGNTLLLARGMDENMGDNKIQMAYAEKKDEGNGVILCLAQNLCVVSKIQN